MLNLANELGFERFSVLGYSGGVPYALACALAISECLTSVGVAGCVGPHDVPGLTEGVDPNILRLRMLSVERPQLASFILWLMMGLQARYIPQRLIAQSMRSLPEPDRRVMAQEEVHETFIEMVREAMRSAAPERNTI